MKAIKNGKIVLLDKVLNGYVLLFDEIIKDIIPNDEFIKLYGENDQIEIIDANEAYISPGFIDMHIHGSDGFDVMDGNNEALMRIAKAIVKNGVTSFLPTTMTMSKEMIYKALDNIKNFMNKDNPFARILGAHLEGPFINKKYKGAQKEDFIIEPSFDFIKDYLDVIKLITIAPEMDKDYKFIEKLKKETNIIISMGHTNATYEEAMEAIDKGVSYTTHMFNAMTPLNHRNPGVVGAALDSDVFCELIADKIHVNPAMFRLLKRVKTEDRIVLITDSMRAGCLKDCISELGGQKVIVKNNSARLTDGTLAGSILKLNEGLKNFKENTDSSICEVVKLASYNPAFKLGLDNEMGSIEVSKLADLVIFDEDFNVLKTFIKGREVFSKN